MKTLFLPFAFLLLFLSSCSRDEVLPDEKKLMNSVDVYVAGSEFNQACYWKNNVKHVLPFGDNISLSKIIIENNNIFVFGSSYQNGKSFFWKNNVKYDIEQYLNIAAGSNYTITDFTVSNDETYITGMFKNVTAPPALQYELCFWKNNVKNIVYQNSNPVFPDEIAYFDNHVYISSSFPVGYFIDNTFFPVNASWMHGFVKTNQGVLVLYNKHETTGPNSTFYYNNTNTNVNYFVDTISNPNLSEGKFITDKYTNDLYISSSYLNNYYYKNNNHIIVPVDNDYYVISDMFVLNNNVYLIKTKQNSYKVYINNVITQSITGTSIPNGSFRSIFVVQN
ncbi:hypothetical protein [Chryseobacterium sp.]|uniref:hypothetical protein n=1 Tax=Chryseobacterium sp. TaxID=1871047 RepID=UPI0011CB624F|nr:hypothetical protein [Chryseobacterium sp.]TXF79344.1 hypothetical protein FUA25_02865 [Chryseobacterium sp.]